MKKTTLKFVCIAILGLTINSRLFAQAGFTHDYFTQSCAPVTVTFTNTSANIGNGDYFEWFFGNDGPYYGGYWPDSVISTMQYTFTTVGWYNITLVAYDTSGTEMWRFNDNIYVQGASINMPDSACPGDVVYLSVNGVDEVYSWDYGDGTGSNSHSLTTHVYDSTGTFTVTAIVNSNDCGTDTISRTITISNSVIPVANIDFWPYPSCPFDLVDFWSWGSSGTFFWNFGDGTDTTLTNSQSVKHSYDNVGNYTVTMTISNGCGFSDSTSSTINIQSNLPVTGSIYYQISPNPACPGDGIVFRLENADEYAGFVWNFGDGSVDSLHSETLHSYGSTIQYNTSLTITNGCGNDTTLFNVVNIQNGITLNPGDYEFGLFPTMTCPGDPVLFFAGGGLPGFLDFGDGDTTSFEGINWQETYEILFHSYSDTGMYTGTVTLTNGCGSSLTDTFIIFVSDTVSISILSEDEGGGMEWVGKWDGPSTTCDEILFLTFQGSTFTWDFGDGNVITTNFNTISHAWQSPGTYPVSVLVENSCGDTITFSDKITIEGPCINICNISTQVNTTNATCGNADGTASVNVSGGTPPFSYLWSNGDTSSSTTGLAAGVQYVTIEDANDCIEYVTVTISDNGAPAITGSVTGVNCYGNANGSIDLNITGGTQPYSVLWSNGSADSSLSNLSGGIYEVTVTDNANCASTTSITVNEPDDLTVSVNTTDATCQNFDGSATANVSGGVIPYGYNWSSGGTGVTESNLLAGNYSVAVTDSNGCVVTTPVSINDAGGPVVTVLSVTYPSCSDSTSGAIDISVSGGTPGYSYMWSTTDTSQDISALTPGIYDVTVTDSSVSVCVGSASIDLTLESVVTPSICVVTVDSATNTNLIVWEKTIGNIQNYKVYKEGSAAGQYNLLATVPYNSMSAFTDTLADPRIRSWRYKISAVDSCGNESPLSGLHKTMHLTMNQGINGEVNLIWDHYEGFSFGTYIIYRSTPTTGLDSMAAIPSNLHSYSDWNHPGGQLYYQVAAVHPTGCDPALAKVLSYNSAKSNVTNKTMPVGIDLQSSIFNLQLIVYPNPYTGNTEINYVLKEKANVTLEVYNVLGKKVKTLVNKTQNAGKYQYRFSGSENGNSSGIFILKLIVNDKVYTKRLVEY